MEIELKYDVNDRETSQKIWEDEEMARYEEANSRCVEEYRGTYFDTEDFILLKNDIAYRIRQEGRKMVASLKWNGFSDGALHTREELNINLGVAEDVEVLPDVSVFKESEIGSELIELVGDKALHDIIRVNVLRKSFRVDMGESLFEISLDDGEIITEAGTEDVHECEIELYSGDCKDLEELGEKLEKRYNMLSQKDSKFARGLKLLGILDR
jgi:triphosphatase